MWWLAAPMAVAATRCARRASSKAPPRQARGARVARRAATLKKKEDKLGRLVVVASAAPQERFERRRSDPYATPLRQANASRLYGLLTDRAAKTLLSYMFETNPPVALWLQRHMEAQSIPFDGPGSQSSISGDDFVNGLLNMAPVNLESKVVPGDFITCDPGGLARRILDIRVEVAREFIDELQHVKEDGAELLRAKMTASLAATMKTETMMTEATAIREDQEPEVDSPDA